MLAHERTGALVPNRTIKLGAGWLARVDPGEPVDVDLADP